MQRSSNRIRSRSNSNTNNTEHCSWGESRFDVYVRRKAWISEGESLTANSIARLPSLSSTLAADALSFASLQRREPRNKQHRPIFFESDAQSMLGACTTHHTTSFIVTVCFRLCHGSEGNSCISVCFSAAGAFIIQLLQHPLPHDDQQPSQHAPSVLQVAHLRTISPASGLGLSAAECSANLPLAS